jgi:hypothetical protein
MDAIEASAGDETISRGTLQQQITFDRRSGSAVASPFQGAVCFRERFSA